MSRLLRVRDSGAGTDFLEGDAGDDYLDGGLGKDRARGGKGIDRCVHDDYKTQSCER